MTGLERSLTAGLAAMLLLAASDASAARRVVRDPHHTDRRGSDYAHTALPKPDPELCVAKCLADARCAAYTYVRVNYQGPQAMCWLKQHAPPTSSSACCESGIITFAPDRPGPPHPTQID